MGLMEQLNEEMKAAMKSGEKRKLETIRSLKSALRDKEIEKRESLTDEEQLQVLSSAAKRRRESIESYKEGGRDDLMAQEEAELEIIETYLPKQMTEEEIRNLVNRVIADTGASTIQDMGKVMGTIMPQVRGKADGSVIQQIVRESLS